MAAAATPGASFIIRYFSRLVTVFALLIAPPLTFASGPNIMAWGHLTPDGRSMGVNQLRRGCGGSAESCARSVQEADLTGISFVALAIAQAKEPEQAVQAKAAAYSRIARQSPAIKEIGIDDFWSFVRRIKSDRPADYLQRLIGAVKAHDSGLRFGITVYEDQLGRLETSDRTPMAVRSMVDRVALYMHFRSSVVNYDADVKKARRLFPNAKIYAGIYHYDRQDYIGCKRGSGRRCDESQEWSLYNEALHVQVGMLKSGAVDGIELYPGRLGREADLKSWDNPKICAPKRRAECIAVTKRMTDALEHALK